MNLKTEKRGGLYFKPNVLPPYIAVTNVLGVMAKPAITYWYGKQIYLAMLANPTLSEKEAMAAPYETSKKAQSRGSTVHDIIEFWVHEKKAIDNIPPEFRPYAQAFYKWVEDNKITIVEHEKTIYSEQHHYAGTCDMIIKLNGSNELMVIDAKTSKDGAIYKESELQVSAYMHALKEEGMKVNRAAVLALSETGTYNFKLADNEIDAFLACLKLWKWANKDVVKKFNL